MKNQKLNLNSNKKEKEVKKTEFNSRNNLLDAVKMNSKYKGNESAQILLTSVEIINRMFDSEKNKK